MDLRELLQAVVDKGASDLHLTTDSAPVLRIDGEMKPLSGFPRLTPKDTARLCLSIITPEQRELFMESHELDLSIGVRDLCRFRVNLFIQNLVFGFDVQPFGNFFFIAKDVHGGGGSFSGIHQLVGMGFPQPFCCP